MWLHILRRISLHTFPPLFQSNSKGHELLQATCVFTFPFWMTSSPSRRKKTFLDRFLAVLPPSLLCDWLRRCDWQGRGEEEEEEGCGGWKWLLLFLCVPSTCVLNCAGSHSGDWGLAESTLGNHTLKVTAMLRVFFFFRLFIYHQQERGAWCCSGSDLTQNGVRLNTWEWRAAQVQVGFFSAGVVWSHGQKLLRPRVEQTMSHCLQICGVIKTNEAAHMERFTRQS